MKKVLLFISLFAVVQLQAANDNIFEGMFHKAVNGAINMVTGVVEIPMQTYKGFKNGFPLIENQFGSKTVGTVLGFFRGGSHAIGRTAWGTIEFAAFWTANRESNEGIGVPLDAKYAWQIGEQHSYFKPTIAEGVAPVGRKLVHGFADYFVGFLELPGQVVKGFREGKPIQGIGKGFWFSISRGVYGTSSILTCIVPNPEETQGYAYKTKWPWSGFTMVEEVPANAVTE